MASRRLVFGAVVIATVMMVFLQRSEAAEERRQSSSSRSRSPSSRGSSRGRVPSHDLPYYMMCPEVYCTPVSRDCQIVEVGVFENRHDLGSRGTVDVSCRTCEYCLDIPHNFPVRGIRNYGSRQEVKETSPCSMFHCPPLPETCIDVRLTSVLISGQQCDECPACYDHTVFSSL